MPLASGGGGSVGAGAVLLLPMVVPMLSSTSIFTGRYDCGVPPALSPPRYAASVPLPTMAGPFSVVAITARAEDADGLWSEEHEPEQRQSRQQTDERQSAKHSLADEGWPMEDCLRRRGAAVHAGTVSSMCGMQQSIGRPRKASNSAVGPQKRNAAPIRSELAEAANENQPVEANPHRLWTSDTSQQSSEARQSNASATRPFWGQFGQRLSVRGGQKNDGKEG